MRRVFGRGPPALSVRPCRVRPVRSALRRRLAARPRPVRPPPPRFPVGALRCGLMAAALASLGRIGADAPRPSLTLGPKYRQPLSGASRGSAARPNCAVARRARLGGSLCRYSASAARGALPRYRLFYYHVGGSITILARPLRGRCLG